VSVCGVVGVGAARERSSGGVLASRDGKASIVSARRRGSVVLRYRGRWWRCVAIGRHRCAALAREQESAMGDSLCRLRPPRRVAIVYALGCHYRLGARSNDVYAILTLKSQTQSVRGLVQCSRREQMAVNFLGRLRRWAMTKHGLRQFDQTSNTFFMSYTALHSSLQASPALNHPSQTSQKQPSSTSSCDPIHPPKQSRAWGSYPKPHDPRAAAVDPSNA